jgi:hypothetical protein
MPSLKLPKKYFTIKEANLALVLIKPIVKDVLEAIASINDLKIKMDTFKENNQDILSEIQTIQHKLIHYTNELKNLGVRLTDIYQGVVDFPTIQDGKEAYLCWKYGEEEICFFHGKNCDLCKRRYLYNITHNY